MNIRIKQRYVIAAVIAFIICLISAVLVSVFKTDVYDLMNVIWFGIIALMTFIQTSRMKASRNIKLLIMGGVGVRLIFAILQSFFQEILPDFVSADDQLRFINIAEKYIQGDYSEFSTNFPYLLKWMFQIFGTNVFVIRLVFIYLWFLAFPLFQKIAGELRGKEIEWLIAFYSLMPWTIYTTTSVMRESVKSFFLMLAVYYLWKWMKKGKNRNLLVSCVSAIPAIWLHNGEVAIWGVIFLAFIFWKPSSQRWRISKFTSNHWRVMRPTWKILLLMGMVAAFKPIYGLFTHIFPGKFAGGFDIERLIGEIYYTYARTNYVPEVLPQNLLEFIMWTPYRMFYFWVSPIPRFWSSWSDVVMFFVDTVPWAFFFIYMVRKQFRSKKYSEMSKVAIPIFVLFTFIYAWGTRNAGTAMRHRDHLLGVFIMTAFMGMKENSTIQNEDYIKEPSVL